MGALLPRHRVDECVAVQIPALRRVRGVAHGDVRAIDVELREVEADAVAAGRLIREEVAVVPVREVETESFTTADVRMDVRPTTA